MPNPFIDYLNALHGAAASNTYAIAEALVRSPYFDSMQVKRALIGQLTKRLSRGRFVLLTGHAGDGKTTLLAQILREIGCDAQALTERGDASGRFALHYVKDFSELTAPEQDEELAAAFRREGASLLIANTGPLLGAFKRLMGSGIESDLLTAMDRVGGEACAFEGYGECDIINIARIDNTDFIRPFLKNIIAEDKWRACDGCAFAEKCPMRFNREMIASSFERSAGFIERVYICLQEYDRRTTIRQMTAHLAFAMTSGLSCDNIERGCLTAARYDYLFSNAFFGVRGEADAPVVGADQIHAISHLRTLAPDRRPTDMDYALQVKQDVSPFFPAALADVFGEATQRGFAGETRHAVLKRAFLFFGQGSADMLKTVGRQVFSEWFEDYLEVCREGKPPKNQIKNALCRAINALFLGEALTDASGAVYLTLRRNNEQMTNVQILRGRIDADDIKLRAVRLHSIFEDAPARYELRLQIHALRIDYRISLPLLNYFAEIRDGIIMTDIDPLLSNGIDSLKAQLLSGARADDDEIRLVFLSGESWRMRTLRISEHRIESD